MRKNKDFWTADRIALLGKASDLEIANRLGISRQAVALRREKLGIARFGSLKGANSHWGQTELGLLRNCNDAEFAKITGRSIFEIVAKRRELQSR